MKKTFFTFCIFILATLVSTASLIAQKTTYKIGETTYIYGETYSTTGLPKVERNATTKKEFLNNLGYDKTPTDYEVDHIIPLSKGGADATYNMQLLTKEQHKQKTASERIGNSLFYTPNSSSNLTYPGNTFNTPKVNSSSTLPSQNFYSSPKSSSGSIGRTTYTGPRGGTYYYNSSGKKTYVKNK